MDIVQSILLAVIEGLTEFLPVSSTGHMIIASHFMGIAGDDYVKMYTVAIQFGAILSVVVLYFKHFFRSVNFYLKLVAAFIPTAIIGLLLKSKIDMMLENVWVVAVALLLGGIVLLFVDKWFEKNEDISDTESEITYKKGFMIGLIQAISMIPGVSRSAATIIGGLSQKLNRKTAAEFSFFLAVPTMFAATVKSIYDIYKEQPHLLNTDNLSTLILGNVVAFVVAMIAIKAFITYLTKYGFKVFGYYRIIAGALLLILLFSGQQLEMF
ncbi:MAG: undecaprenyl-diphosphate phosphatase [Bacteroidia bacterium]|nr:undecaprenyl-diphosphate phosphatase [Bacteroidia bacterium]